MAIRYMNPIDNPRFQKFSATFEKFERALSSFPNIWQCENAALAKEFQRIAATFLEQKPPALAVHPNHTEGNCS